MTEITRTSGKPRVQPSLMDLTPANAPTAAGYVRTATSQAVNAVIDRGARGSDQGHQGAVLEQGLKDGEAMLKVKLQALAQAKAQLSEQTDPLPELQKQAAQAQAVADQFQAQLEQAKSAAAPTDQALKAAQDAVQTASTAQQQAQAAVDAANAALQQAKANSPFGSMALFAHSALGGGVGQAQDKLTAAQAQLPAAQAALTAAQAQLSAAQAAAAPTTQAAQAAQARAQAATVQAHSAAAAVQTQAGKVAQAQAAVQAAQSEVDQVQAGILALAQKIDAAQGSGASAVAQASQQIAQAQLQHNAQELQGAQSAVKAQEQALTQAQAKVAAERAKVAPLQAKASAAEEKVAQLQGQADIAKVPSTQAQAQIAKWQSALESAQANVQAAQAALAVGQRAMADAGTYKKAAHVAAGQQGAQYQIDTANAQLSAAQAQAALAQAKLTEAKAQAAPHQQAAQAAQAQADVAAQAAQALRAQADAQAQAADAAVDQEIAARQALAMAQGKVVQILQAQADAAQSALGKAGHLSATAAGTAQAQAAAQALVDTQQGVLAAARSKVDAERAQGKPLDAQAAQAEAQATELKGQADAAQLAATRAQGKVDASQNEVNAASAAVQQAQANLDAGHAAMTNANVNIKKKTHRRAEQAVAQSRIDAATQELAAAQARLGAAQPVLAQAQADAVPVLKAAQDAQAKWQGAAELAAVARAKADAQVKTVQQATALEVAAQASLQAAQTTLAQLGQVEGGVRQEQVSAGLLSKAQLSDLVQAKQAQLDQAAASVDTQEHTLGSARASETQERTTAIPLQTEAYAGQLIAGNLVDDARSTAQVHQGAAQALNQAQSQYDAANARVQKAKQSVYTAQLAMNYAEGKIAVKKQQKAMAQAQPVLDAAKQELVDAQAGLHTAQLALTAAQRAAAPLLQEAQDAELAARGAVQAAIAKASAADAQGAWIDVAGVRHQAADNTLATAQARLVQATALHAQLLQALAGATDDKAAAKNLGSQAQDGRAWAAQYAQLADGQRAAAQAGHDEQVHADALGVQAAGAQTYGVWLQAKVADAAQTYEQSRTVLPQVQDQFRQATEKAGASARATDAAHTAMVEKDLDTALQFAASRGADVPRSGSADAMKSASQDLSDKAAALQAWQDAQMKKRKSLDKQLHLMDDMAQFKEGSAALQQARAQSLDSAKDTAKASQAAIDAGEAVQSAVGHAQRMGDALQAAQSQLTDASAFAQQASAQAQAQAEVAVQAHQAEQSADARLLAGLQKAASAAAPEVAPLAANAKSVADVAAKETAGAQTSAAHWAQATQAMQAWAAQEGLSLDDVKAAVAEGAKQLSEFAQQSGVALKGVYQLNDWANALIQEDAQRKQSVSELHQRRELADVVEKKRKMQALIKMAIMAIPTIAAMAVGQFEVLPMVLGMETGAMGVEAGAMLGTLAEGAGAVAEGAGTLAEGMGALAEGAGNLGQLMEGGATALRTAGQGVANLGRVANFTDGVGFAGRLAQNAGTLVRTAETLQQIPLTSLKVGSTVLGRAGATAGVFGAAGAAGNAIGQAGSLAAGLQDKFDFKELGLSGLSAALTAGAFAGVQGSALGEVLLPASTGLDVAKIGMRGVTAGLINSGVQGGMVGLGLQDKFDWSQVAAMALILAAGGELNRGMAEEASKPDSALGRFIRQNRTLAESIGTSILNGVANAATAPLGGNDLSLNSLLGKIAAGLQANGPGRASNGRSGATPSVPHEPVPPTERGLAGQDVPGTPASELGSLAGTLALNEALVNPSAARPGAARAPAQVAMVGRLSGLGEGVFEPVPPREPQSVMTDSAQRFDYLSVPKGGSLSSVVPPEYAAMAKARGVDARAAIAMANGLDPQNLNNIAQGKQLWLPGQEQFTPQFVKAAKTWNAALAYADAQFRNPRAPGDFAGRPNLGFGASYRGLSGEALPGLQPALGNAQQQAIRQAAFRQGLDKTYGLTGNGQWANRLSASIDNYQGKLYLFGREVFDALGVDHMRDALNAGYQENQAAADHANSRAVEQGAIQKWDDVRDVKSFGNYFGGLVTQTLPYIGEAVAGGSLARMALGAAATARTAALTGTGGGVVATYPSSAGDIFSNQIEQSGRTDKAFGFGVGGMSYAGLNALGVTGAAARGKLLSNSFAGLEKLPGASGVAARAGANSALGAVGEALGEAGQEFINQGGRMQVDANTTFWNAESAARFKESAIGGGLVGGFFGLGGGRRGNAAAGASTMPGLQDATGQGQGFEPAPATIPSEPQTAAALAAPEQKPLGGITPIRRLPVPDNKVPGTILIDHDAYHPDVKTLVYQEEGSRGSVTGQLVGGTLDVKATRAGPYGGPMKASDFDVVATLLNDLDQQGLLDRVHTINRYLFGTATDAAQEARLAQSLKALGFKVVPSTGGNNGVAVFTRSSVNPKVDADATVQPGRKKASVASLWQPVKIEDNNNVSTKIDVNRSHFGNVFFTYNSSSPSNGRIFAWIDGDTIFTDIAPAKNSHGPSKSDLMGSLLATAKPYLSQITRVVDTSPDNSPATQHSGNGLSQEDQRQAASQTGIAKVLARYRFRVVDVRSVIVGEGRLNEVSFQRSLTRSQTDTAGNAGPGNDSSLESRVIDQSSGISAGPGGKGISVAPSADRNRWRTAISEYIPTYWRELPSTSGRSYTYVSAGAPGEAGHMPLWLENDAGQQFPARSPGLPAQTTMKELLDAADRGLVPGFNGVLLRDKAISESDVVALHRKLGFEPTIFWTGARWLITSGLEEDSPAYPDVHFRMLVPAAHVHPGDHVTASLPDKKSLETGQPVIYPALILSPNQSEKGFRSAWYGPVRNVSEPAIELVWPAAEGDPASPSSVPAAKISLRNTGNGEGVARVALEGDVDVADVMEHVLSLARDSHMQTVTLEADLSKASPETWTQVMRAAGNVQTQVAYDFSTGEDLQSFIYVWKQSSAGSDIHMGEGAPVGVQNDPRVVDQALPPLNGDSGSSQPNPPGYREIRGTGDLSANAFKVREEGGTVFISEIDAGIPTGKFLSQGLREAGIDLLDEKYKRIVFEDERNSFQNHERLLAIIDSALDDRPTDAINLRADNPSFEFKKGKDGAPGRSDFSVTLTRTSAAAPSSMAGPGGDLSSIVDKVLAGSAAGPRFEVEDFGPYRNSRTFQFGSARGPLYIKGDLQVDGRLDIEVEVKKLKEGSRSDLLMSLFEAMNNMTLSTGGNMLDAVSKVRVKWFSVGDNNYSDYVENMLQLPVKEGSSASKSSAERSAKAALDTPDAAIFNLFDFSEPKVLFESKNMMTVEFSRRSPRLDPEQIRRAVLAEPKKRPGQF